MAEYIVVTTPDTDQKEFVAHLLSLDIEMQQNYRSLRRHYRVALSDEQHAALLADPRVELIEAAEGVVTLGEIQPIAVQADGYGDNWGLSRVDQREWDDRTWYPNTGEYRYFRNGGNVDAYIVDTGCRMSHQDFGGRAVPLYDHFLPSSDPLYCGDTEGHGTHVASTVAGLRHGVAKGATLQICKVFQGPNTTIAAIVGGINAVLRHHNAKKTRKSQVQSVMNLSLGGPAILSLEQAVNDCIAAGIVVVVAAGNEGQNLDSTTYNVMPAEIRRAITVGATDIQDWVAPFSNYGSILDVFAPGHYIVAASHTSDTGTSMKSGTSMAAPHVAGVAALHLDYPGLGTDATFVAQVHDKIIATATAGTLQMQEAVRKSGSPDKLLHSYYIAPEVTAATFPMQPLAPVDPVYRRWRKMKDFNVATLSRQIDAVEKRYRDLGHAVLAIDALMVEVETAAGTTVAARGQARVRALAVFMTKLAALAALIAATPARPGSWH
jgi:hypothetical protein